MAPSRSDSKIRSQRNAVEEKRTHSVKALQKNKKENKKETQPISRTRKAPSASQVKQPTKNPQAGENEQRLSDRGSPLAMLASNQASMDYDPENFSPMSNPQDEPSPHLVASTLETYGFGLPKVSKTNKGKEEDDLNGAIRQAEEHLKLSQLTKQNEAHMEEDDEELLAVLSEKGDGEQASAQEAPRASAQQATLPTTRKTAPKTAHVHPVLIPAQQVPRTRSRTAALRSASPSPLSTPCPTPPESPACGNLEADTTPPTPAAPRVTSHTATLPPTTTTQTQTQAAPRATSPTATLPPTSTTQTQTLPAPRATSPTATLPPTSTTPTQTQAAPRATSPTATLPTTPATKMPPKGTGKKHTPQRGKPPASQPTDREMREQEKAKEKKRREEQEMEEIKRQSMEEQEKLERDHQQRTTAVRARLMEDVGLVRTNGTGDCFFHCINAATCGYPEKTATPSGFLYGRHMGLRQQLGGYIHSLTPATLIMMNVTQQEIIDDLTTQHGTFKAIDLTTHTNINKASLEEASSTWATPWRDGTYADMAMAWVRWQVLRGEAFASAPVIKCMANMLNRSIHIYDIRKIHDHDTPPLIFTPTHDNMEPPIRILQYNLMRNDMGYPNHFDLIVNGSHAATQLTTTMETQRKEPIWYCPQNTSTITHEPRYTEEQTMRCKVGGVISNMKETQEEKHEEHLTMEQLPTTTPTSSTVTNTGRLRCRSDHVPHKQEG